MEKEYFTKTEIIKRGWTESMINELLGNADKEKQNPYYKKASPMKLYLIDRVKIIEQTNSYKVLKEKKERCKKSAQKAVETKKNNIIEYAKSIKVEIRILNKDTLMARAIENYNHENQHCKYANHQSDIEFLERIQVNYIRHCLTNYEYELYKIFGKVGVDLGYQIIKEKILEAISLNYPHLKNECERQISMNSN